jgi:hypothetical protein
LEQATAIADVLRQLALERDPSLRTSPAVQEDFGGVVTIGEVQVTIVFAPINNSDFSWAVQFASRGDSAPVKRLVADIVESQPAKFRNVEWLSVAEFRDIY